MSGRGKGGKGLGKGGAKRHRPVLRDNIQGISKPAIRRLARRGGVKRISGLMYDEVRGALKVFLENVIRDAVTYTEHARRKTVTAMDVVYALKRQGRPLYGFGAELGGKSFKSSQRRRTPAAAMSEHAFAGANVGAGGDDVGTPLPIDTSSDAMRWHLREKVAVSLFYSLCQMFHFSITGNATGQQEMLDDRRRTVCEHQEELEEGDDYVDAILLHVCLQHSILTQQFVDKFSEPGVVAFDHLVQLHDLNNVVEAVDVSQMLDVSPSWKGLQPKDDSLFPMYTRIVLFPIVLNYHWVLAAFHFTDAVRLRRNDDDVMPPMYERRFRVVLYDSFKETYDKMRKKHNDFTKRLTDIVRALEAITFTSDRPEFGRVRVQFRRVSGQVVQRDLQFMESCTRHRSAAVKFEGVKYFDRSKPKRIAPRSSSLLVSDEVGSQHDNVNLLFSEAIPDDDLETDDDDGLSVFVPVYPNNGFFQQDFSSCGLFVVQVGSLLATNGTILLSELPVPQQAQVTCSRVTSDPRRRALCQIFEYWAAATLAAFYSNEKSRNFTFRQDDSLPRKLRPQGVRGPFFALMQRCLDRIATTNPSSPLSRYALELVGAAPSTYSNEWLQNSFDGDDGPGLHAVDYLVDLVFDVFRAAQPTTRRSRRR